MLKREITYEDFEGNKITEIFYFNLSKTELVELEATYTTSLEQTIRRMIETNNRGALVEEFKRVILMCIGEKSEDGKKFMKSDQIRNEFEHHAAFDTLFIELASNDDAAATFLKGVIPKDLAAAMPDDPLPPPNIQPAENIQR